MSAGECAARADGARSPGRPSSQLLWGDTQPRRLGQGSGLVGVPAPVPSPVKGSQPWDPSQRGQEPGDGAALSRPPPAFLQPWERKPGACAG